MFVKDIEVIVRGKLLKIAGLRNEMYDQIGDPVAFIRELRDSGVRANLFTFLQEPDEREPKYSYHIDWDSISMLPISTFEHWTAKQIDAKTRNMVRKAGKKE